MSKKVRPMTLDKMAASIARSHAGCQGVIVLVDYPDGICMGVEGLKPKGTVQALSLAIHIAYAHEERLRMAEDSEPPPGAA